MTMSGMTMNSDLREPWSNARHDVPTEVIGAQRIHDRGGIDPVQVNVGLDQPEQLVRSPSNEKLDRKLGSVSVHISGVRRRPNDNCTRTDASSGRFRRRNEFSSAGGNTFAGWNGFRIRREERRENGHRVQDDEHHRRVHGQTVPAKAAPRQLHQREAAVLLRRRLARRLTAADAAVPCRALDEPVRSSAPVTDSECADRPTPAEYRRLDCRQST